MMVPIILIAIGLFFLYARLNLNNTMFGLVMGNILLAVPFPFITALAGLQTYDMTQEQVARSLGASRPRAFLKVTLPQIAPSIIAGALFAFVAAWDEVVLALFISGGENQTLTRKIFLNIRDQVDPAVAAVSSMLMVVSLVALSASVLVNRRRDS